MLKSISSYSQSKITSIVFLFITALLLSKGIHAKESNFDFRVYENKDGFNSPEIYCVFTDAKSYLWIGGADGLTKYDGKTFINYNKLQGLNDSQINCITQNEKGEIYCGTRSGVSVFDGFHFKNIKILDDKNTSLKSHYVKTIFISENNDIYAGCIDGLFIFNRKKNGFIRHKNIKSFVQNISTGSNGAILITSNDGVFALKNKVLTKIDFIENPLSLKITSLKKISNTIFWGTTNSGIVKLKLFKNRFTILKKYGSESMINVFQQKSKRLLFTGKTGLLLTVKKDFIQTIDLKNHLTHLQVQTATEDYQGNIWLATTLGLVKMSETIAVKSKITDIVNPPVASMVADNAGKIYFGTIDGLMVLDNFKLKKIHVSNDPNDNFISALTFKNNQLFVGTFSGKVFKFEDNKFQFLLETKNRNACVYRILPIKKDEIWVATGEEIIKYKNGKKELFKISPQFTQDVLLDRFGSIWFANYSKLVFYKNGKMHEAPAALKKFDNFVTLSEDNNGILWIGTYGNGLLRYSDGKVTQVKTIDGLTNDYISSSFFEKERNILWVGTMYGVSKIQLNGKSDIQSIHNYLNEANRETYGCVQNAITKLPNGTILISVGDELYEFNPGSNFDEKIKLNLQISNMKVNRQDIFKLKYKTKKTDNWTGLPNSPHFNFEQNNIEFTFNTVDFHNPQNIKYSWKLEGNDGNWIPFNERNYVSYTNLPHGKYSLKVKSINQSGEKSSIITFPFLINKPYFLEWWFITLSILIPLLLLFWYVRWRINKIKKVEAERTENYVKLAESELKALRAQMNPHFMFNTLNAIQEIVLTGEDEKSRVYFADFAKMMRMILMNSTEKLITLEKEIAFIELYLKFEKIRFQNKFQIKFDIDPNLETHSIRLPGMLLQPLIENAINHGLLHKIGEGLLHIRFFEKRIKHINYLYCVIQDNGVGYKKSEELNHWKKSEHRSVSSSILEDRIKILNSLYGKEKFTLKLTDLSHIENQTGTKVELIIAIE